MSNYLQEFQMGYSYPDYKQLVINLLESGSTTGEDNSESMLNYTKMNIHRMNRVEKSTILSEDLKTYIDDLNQPLNLLVISEGWCGDAAQIVPVIYKMIDYKPEMLKLKIVLRDKNISLIDQHLTNGGRSIPVLLVLDKEGNLLKSKWGPRPETVQSLMKEWKEAGIIMPEISEKLHSWYAKDKTHSTQESLLNYFKEIKLN